MSEVQNMALAKQNFNFTKRITQAFDLFLLPAKISFNSFQINIKRKKMMKAYDNYLKIEKISDPEKKEKYTKKYSETYIAYLESIDKNIMDSIYKKLKLSKASKYEKRVLSDYHKIASLKGEDYIDYKLRKQRYLLDLDYNNMKENNASQLTKEYKKLYIEKQDKLYKGILKNYSIKLADDRKYQKATKLEVYLNVFKTIEEYLNKIIPIKFEIDGKNKYKKIMKEYEKYTTFLVGKLDEKAFLEKNMTLLSISRNLFTHSLPLVVAEQCYEKLLKDTRYLLVNSSNENKRKKTFDMLYMLVEEYNVKLLSVKIYWEDKKERQACKNFLDAYLNAKDKREKEIYILLEELRRLAGDNSVKMKQLKKIYKSRLSELGVMQSIYGINTNLSRKNYKRLLKVLVKK